MRLNHEVVIDPCSWTVETTIGLDSLDLAPLTESIASVIKSRIGARCQVNDSKRKILSGSSVKPRWDRQTVVLLLRPAKGLA